MLMLRNAQRLERVDMHLVRKCLRPVRMIKPGRGRRFARIRAAGKPDREGRERSLVNGLIMDLATSLARTQRAELCRR